MNPKLSEQDLRDLFNALDILRQCYAPGDMRDAVLEAYAPGTEGHERTFSLYKRLEIFRG